MSLAVVECCDGRLLVDSNELETLRGATHSPALLEALLHQRPAAPAELAPPCVVDVSTRCLMLLRTLLRQGVMPDDEEARVLLDSGAMRRAADALGGFDAVDRALSERARHIRAREALRPVDDAHGDFDWRSLVCRSEDPRERFHETERSLELQLKGFHWTSSEEVHSNCTVHHFRRRAHVAPP